VFSYFRVEPGPHFHQWIHLTLVIQQARAVTFMAQSLQAISQFAVVVDDDGDKQKRVKSVLQQRCRWN
jgi:hypothetical protein